MKKTILWLGVLAAVCCAGQVYAAEGKKMTAPQNRMKTCAVQYHEKKIVKSEYHKFMSQCLRTHPVVAKAVPAIPATPAKK